MRRFVHASATAFATVFAAVQLTGCIPFSSFQSARIAEPGKASVVFGYSRVDLDDTETFDPGANEFTLVSRVGTRSPNFDYGFRAAGVFAADDFTSVSLGLHARAGVVPDYLTLQAPFSWLLAEGGYHDFYVHPTAIASWPVTPSFEINGSGTLYLGVFETDDLYSYSLGLAVGPRNATYRIRPEVAWLRGSGDGGSTQFGVGLEFVGSGRQGSSGGNGGSIWGD
ncbi:MAG: hypothetical protein R3E97_04595 [Candidatus Eisenbacteria bacterium]